MNLNEVRTILAERGLKPQKSRGQNFLVDANMLKKLGDIIAAAGPYETILEIGPGLGALSRVLAPLAPTMYAVEFDAGLFAYLSEHKPADHIQLVHADALTINPSDFPRPLAIIGNIPYNISSQLLFKTLEFFPGVTAVFVMVQEEFGRRLLAKPKSEDYGILSLLLGNYFKAELVAKIGRGCFYPPPAVDSIFLKLMPHETPQIAHESYPRFAALIRSVFNQRRKMLRNTLRFYVQTFGDWDDFLALLQENKQDHLLDQRPETLDANTFILLTHLLEKLNALPSP